MPRGRRRHRAIGSALAAGGLGYAARRIRWHGWLRFHMSGMAISYVAILTAFYVDNGPFLPLWDRLPHIAYWLLPSLAGIPLIWIALRRFQQRPILNSQPAVDWRRQRPR